MREHVNPLSRRYQVPTPPPQWTAIYAQPAQPLTLDIGCGRGEYLLQMAQKYSDRNFLGIEIRKALVDTANTVCQEQGLGNLYYCFANVNVSLPSFFTTRWLTEVSIQFPDPWFKRKQRKRRVVTPELVQTLSQFLLANAQILLQSDLEWVWQDMHKCFCQNPDFQPLDHYPTHIPTEREAWTIAQGGAIYRSAFAFNGTYAEKSKNPDHKGVTGA